MINMFQPFLRWVGLYHVTRHHPNGFLEFPSLAPCPEWICAGEVKPQLGGKVVSGLLSGLRIWAWFWSDGNPLLTSLHPLCDQLWAWRVIVITTLLGMVISSLLANTA